MTKTRILAAAALAAVLPSSAIAQAAQAPKPVSRADYIRTLDTRFNTIDTNHDAKLSKQELVVQQQRELQNARARISQQLQDQFHKLDTNKDGQLSIQEFLAAAPPIRTAETPDQMLQRLDSNHDGKLSPDEFRAPDLAKFNRVDNNHDGIVTPAEIQAATARK
ncbi:MAG: EF-hand domain-containing protein [Sphingomicrobium sp.]